MSKFYRFLSTLLLLLPWPVSAAEFIQSFHSEIEIQRNGDLHVTETIVVRAEGKSIRRGIYRDFPTRYKDVMPWDCGQPVAELRMKDYPPSSVSKNKSAKI